MMGAFQLPHRLPLTGEVVFGTMSGGHKDGQDGRDHAEHIPNLVSAVPQRRLHVCLLL
jgi:hypothetical protein